MRRVEKSEVVRYEGVVKGAQLRTSTGTSNSRGWGGRLLNLRWLCCQTGGQEARHALGIGADEHCVQVVGKRDGSIGEWCVVCGERARSESS